MGTRLFLIVCIAACGKVESNADIDAPAAVVDAAVDAPPIDAPPPVKRVFISSLTFFADFGGTAQADAACQNMANGASLSGVYRAWLSTAADSVRNRFNQATIPYKLVDDTLIANDFTDLTDGTHANFINLTETGTPLPTSTATCHGPPTCFQTFTGTNTDGTASTLDDQCLNWTTRVFQVAGGGLNTFVGGDSTPVNAGMTPGSEWTVRASGFRCDFQARIYCFQQ